MMAIKCLDKIQRTAEKNIRKHIDAVEIMFWVDILQECEQSIRIAFKRHKKIRPTSIANCTDDAFEEQLAGLLSFARAAIDPAKRDAYHEEKILENVAWHHSRLMAIILKF